MSAARSLAHSAWIAMLVLLLGLAPFIHGHLGQPLLQGWHVHPQVVAAAQPAGATTSTPHATGFALDQPETADVEVAAGIVSARLQPISPAAVFPADDVPTLAAFLQVVAAAPSAAIASALQQASETAASRLRHGLPPPAQAPPSFAFHA